MSFSILGFRFSIGRAARRQAPACSANPKSKIQNQQSEAGFTLTEVLISVFVLAIGLIGVISVFPVGIEATQKTLDKSASALAVSTAVAELQYREDGSGNSILGQFEHQIGMYSSGASVYGLYPDETNPLVGKDVGSSMYQWNAILARSPLLDLSGTTDRHSIFVQIAFYRGDPGQFTGSGATFTNDSTDVTFGAPPAPFGLKAGVFVRSRDATYPSRWYLVESVDLESSPVRAVLVAPFERDTHTGDFMLTRNVYETILTVR